MTVDCCRMQLISTDEQCHAQEWSLCEGSSHDPQSSPEPTQSPCPSIQSLPPEFWVKWFPADSRAFWAELTANKSAMRPPRQDASTQTSHDEEPATVPAGCLHGLRRLIRRIFAPLCKTRQSQPKKRPNCEQIAQPVLEFGGNFQSYTTRSMFVTILNWFALDVLNIAQGPKIYPNSYMGSLKVIENDSVRYSLLQ